MSYDATALVIDDEDTMSLTMLDATGNPTPVVFELRSADSPATVALVDQFVNKRLNRMQKRQGAAQPITSQELRSESIDTLVACVKGWTPFKWFDLDPIPFSHDNVRDVLTRNVTWREQVDAAVKDRAGFTTA